jgi:hypothetical protein
MYGDETAGLAKSPTQRTAAAGRADSDSDVELIERAGARRAGSSTGKAKRAAEDQVAARPALDEKSAQLLANSRALLHNLQRGDDADDDEEVDPPHEASPVQLRHVAAAAAAAAAAPDAGRRGPGARSPAAGAPPRGIPRVVLKLETSRSRSIQVRLKATDKLRKAFDAFRAEAIEQVRRNAGPATGGTHWGTH